MEPTRVVPAATLTLTLTLPLPLPLPLPLTLALTPTPNPHQTAQATVLTVLQTHRMPSGPASELPWVPYDHLRR